MTVSQLYEAKSLPPADQVQLATLLLSHIPLQAIPGYSDEWSDEDMREATAYSMACAQRTYPKDETVQ